MAKLALALGSNLGNRWQLLTQAIELLEQRVGRLLTLSPFVETEPWGFDSAEPFLNACLLMHSEFSPEEVLATTAQIERELGRKAKSQGEAYEDREIDIDILLYDDLQICLSHLQIPHPLMAERLFVLEPLALIAPTERHSPSGLMIASLLQKLKSGEER